MDSVRCKVLVSNRTWLRQDGTISDKYRQGAIFPSPEVAAMTAKMYGHESWYIFHVDELGQIIPTPFSWPDSGASKPNDPE